MKLVSKRNFAQKPIYKYFMQSKKVLIFLELIFHKPFFCWKVTHTLLRTNGLSNLLFSAVCCILSTFNADCSDFSHFATPITCPRAIRGIAIFFYFCHAFLPFLFWFCFIFFFFLWIFFIRWHCFALSSLQKSRTFSILSAELKRNKRSSGHPRRQHDRTTRTRRTAAEINKFKWNK